MSENNVSLGNMRQRALDALTSAIQTSVTADISDEGLFDAILVVLRSKVEIAEMQVELVTVLEEQIELLETKLNYYKTQEKTQKSAIQRFLDRCRGVN